MEMERVRKRFVGEERFCKIRFGKSGNEEEGMDAESEDDKMYGTERE